MHSADAARLILPHCIVNDAALTAHWLVHLADRTEPLTPSSQRQYLSWVLLRERLSSPRWVTVNPKYSSP
jgi:hypothetical protein